MTAYSFDEAREQVCRSEGMDAIGAESLLETLLSEKLPVAQGAELLTLLAERGETSIEVAAFARGLRARCTRVSLDTACLDVCGTGGSGRTRFNTSTFVAFLCAAAGIPVAKHGNRGSQRANGSFDLLEALGIPLEMSPIDLARIHAETKLCFLFARAVHPAVAAAAPYRKAAGRRTIFNLAGPLANPAVITRQMIGAADLKTARVLAGALSRLGLERALVVHGHPGVDDCSITGPTTCLTVTPVGVSEAVLDRPLHPDLDPASLPGGDAQENAEIFRRLAKDEEPGPLRDLVLMNATAAIDTWRGRAFRTDSPSYRLAEKTLASGAVADLLRRFSLRARQIAR